MAVKVATPPRGGLWRVGRSPDPICFGDPLPAELLDDARLGNRFDSPTQSYRVSYFSSSIAGCYGETLARFRPDPELAALAREDGFMGVGEVPADWRVRRLAVRAAVTGAGRPVYAGVRYLSRLSSDWECWAVFEHAQIRELERKPILRSDRDLAKVARLYDLTVF